MIASSLLEAAASMAITAVVLATLTAGLGATAVGALGAWSKVHANIEARHREHLIEIAFSRASGAGGHVAACSSDTILLAADLDGDGSIDASSAEHTSFSIVTRSNGDHALTQRLGAQSMTLTDELAAGDHIVCKDATGAPASDPAVVRVVEVPIAARSALVLSRWFAP